MNTELYYILSLLEGVKPAHNQIIRVVYPGVLNRYESLFNKPTIHFDTLADHKSPKIAEKYECATACGCVLVLLCRKVKALPLQWHIKGKFLTFCIDSMMPLHAWVDIHMRSERTINWDDDIKAMNADVVIYCKAELLRVRSAVNRTTAILKVKRLMLLLQDSNHEGTKTEAMLVLEFMYHAENLCGENIPPQPFYPMEFKEKAQEENNHERDTYILLCRHYYTQIENPQILEMLISCGTDMWDEYGYSYPPFFSECGKPIKSRYKLFTCYIESYIKPK